jgi:chromosome segregation ATPase
MGSVHDRDLLPMRTTFDIVRRGYDCTQVDYQLAQLRADLRIALADRDAGATQAAELARTLEAAHSEIDDLRAQIKRLAAPPTTVEGMSERVVRMLHDAQSEAAEITAKATIAAEAIRADVEREASKLRARYKMMIAEAEQRRSSMESEHERAMADVRRQGEEILTQAQQRAEALDVESAARRHQVEEDFNITMSERRREMNRKLAQDEATSKIEAKRRVDEATDVARRLVTEADQTAIARVKEANRQVEALHTQRRQLLGQLQAVSSKLDAALRQLCPTPGEDDVLAEEQTPRS